MSAPSRPDRDDVQAIVDRGFGTLSAVRYLLLRVRDAGSAKSWLGGLAVTSVGKAMAERQACIRQIAFTAAGLRALGLAVDDITGFAPEFLEGMASDPSRSRRLGDLGANAPVNWVWGTGEREPHVLIVLIAGDNDIDGFEAELLGSMPAAGCELLLVNRSNDSTNREPFGFRDGVSQPQLDWDATLKPGGAADRVYRNVLAIGEFVLGYDNEYGFVTDYPSQDGLGLNGSYLVYRQLVQDVRGFWQWLAATAGADGAVPLAEAFVGRQIDGAPLPGLMRQEVPGDPSTLNNFGFNEDPDGLVCPIGAHIRRANPRSSDDPQGHRGFFRDIMSSLGLKGTAMHDAVASARFHRIARRGRGYGPTLSPADAMRSGEISEEAGLHFICLNANLARQFEFVQGAWVDSAYFAGLSGEKDPIMGNRLPANGDRATDAFNYTDEAGNPRLCAGLPRFVTVKGGAYFFLPGLNGLKESWLRNASPALMPAEPRGPWFQLNRSSPFGST